MNLLILHLSDMHFTEDGNYDNDKVTSIVAAMNSYTQNIDHVLFIVSGDLAFSGKKKECIRVSRFFHSLKANILKRYNIQDTKFVMVPGNHDVDYDFGDRGRSGLEALERENLYEQEIRDEFQKQEQFYVLARSFGCFQNKGSLYQRTLTYGDKRIQINLINTAIFSSLAEDQGFHYLPERDIARLSEQNDADFVFSVMHHPHHWYSAKCKKQIETALYSRSDLIFVGHEHYESDMSIKKDNSVVNIFAAGELSNKGDWSRSEFHIAVLNLDTREYTSHKYHWNEAEGIYQEFGEIRKLILSKDRFNTYGMPITEDFMNSHFNEDKHYISKSFMDYFVFPLLEEIPDERHGSSVTRDINNMPDLMEKIRQNKYILITGLLESGKTVLMRALFRELTKDYLVIYLNGADVRSDSEKTIKNAFEDVFGHDPAKYEKFRQAPKEQRVLIVDDFDAIDKAYQDSFSDYIFNAFGMVIESALEEIELDIENRLKKWKNSLAFLKLRIAPFYTDKRRQLITKIVEIIGNDGQSQENIINILCDALTRQKSLYSWNPDFIVQFTNYFYKNIGESTKNDGNIYSKVFENSLTSLIKPFAGEQMTVDKIFTVLDKIAYRIYTQKEYPISATKISEVIDDYNKIFDSEVNAIKFISILIKAKILKETDGGYLFYERNYLAYFTAREIRQQVYDGNYDMIKHVMEYSYMNINADILLFVTYITENRKIISMLMDYAESTVNDWEEFSLSPVNIPYLIGSAQELIKPVKKGDREKEEQRHIEQERAETTALALANDSSIFEGESEELDFLQEMMRSISLMTILARALPSFEHLLEKDYKDKCVKLIYTMPLRIFYIWASQVDKVRSEMVQLIKDFLVHEWEYRNNKSGYELFTDDKALAALRWDSSSLLLELMHASIAYSTRENTWRFIDRFDYNSAPTYRIEHLMGIAKRDTVGAFSNEAISILEDKTPFTKMLVRRVARDYMVNSKKITSAETQRMNQKIFSGQIKQQSLLIQQAKNKKKE